MCDRLIDTFKNMEESSTIDPKEYNSSLLILKSFDKIIEIKPKIIKIITIPSNGRNILLEFLKLFKNKTFQTNTDHLT
jgi:hypothetical protein